jgi:hypothetical protein
VPNDDDDDDDDDDTKTRISISRPIKDTNSEIILRCVQKPTSCVSDNITRFNSSEQSVKTAQEITRKHIHHVSICRLFY